MKISLITVSYNSGSTIKATLDSVLAQKYQELEYIIVDGGSSDNTLGIINEYSDLITQCISEPDKGIYDAMNKGVRCASGDVIGILNSDDFYLHAHVLDDVANVFRKDPQLDVILGDVDFFLESRPGHSVRRYRAGRFKPWMFRFGLMPPHPAVFVRKSAYHRIGLYKLGYQIASDFDFLTRLLLIDEAKYQLLPKTLVRMRLGGVSTSGVASMHTITKEICRSLRENKVKTNCFFVMLRLPIKFIKQVIT